MSLHSYFEETYNSNDLKTFLDLVGARGVPTRKAERAEMLTRILTSPMEIKRLVGELGDLGRLALASAFHNDGIFQADAFHAQYGSLPERPHKKGWSWYGEAMLLDVFFRSPRRYADVLGDGALHPEIMPLLAPLMPPPDRFELAGVQESPTNMVVDELEFDVYTVETESTGVRDLLLYLTLLEQGEIRLSASGTKLTNKSAEVLSRQILQAQGDTAHGFDVELRVNGLTHFAEQAGLAGRYSGLSETARTYLATEDPVLLLDAFETWCEEGNYDELTRIPAIRGTRSKKITLTPPASRRSRIVEALSWSPVGVWISIFEFYRALKVWHLDFEIEEDGLDRLYVGYQHSRGGYREAWASWSEMWMLTNGLYINAVLWEFLGAIGAIDLLVCDDPDFFPAETYWGHERPYSHYDGLAGFRITPLGAYLFGQADAYAAAHAATKPLFSMDGDGSITVTNTAALSPAHRAQLEQIADVDVKSSGARYTVSVPKLLSVLENAPDLDLPRTFLAQRNDGPVPAEIDELFARVERDSTAFKTQTQMVTVRVRSAELAQLAIDDPVAGKIAQRLDARTLLIPANRETAFRNALRNLGYGLRGR